MKRFSTYIMFILFAASCSVSAQNRLPLNSDGTIPVWLTNGPFEIKIVGFGDISDENPVDVKNIAPVPGQTAVNNSVSEGKTQWLYTSTKGNGYTDLNEYYGWKTFNTTEKIWYVKVVYAYAKIFSDKEQKVQLKYGGNTITGITLNGDSVYTSLQEINSIKDNFSSEITLRKGVNSLLIRTANSHKNNAPAFFDPIRFEWGFYCRLEGLNGQPVTGVDVPVEENHTDLNVSPTFFYKRINKKLQQIYFVDINSPGKNNSTAELSFKYLGEEHKLKFDNIEFGINRREFFLPEPVKPETICARIELAGLSLEKQVELKALPKYELYFMPMTHMDIGYTNPQPVVVERQLATLDQVVDKCRTDKKFKWTIETMWLLDNYRQSRSETKFKELISLIKEGRIAVSPIYTNPFTGWVSESEMAESFRLAQEYKVKYGIEYFGAVYNDVPGQSWALPQALKKAGVKVLVDGINELYADYKFQKSLPKIFNWVGSDNDTLPLYLTEAYVEGSRYGLERGVDAISYRLWHRINNIMRREYPFNKILISGAFSDNSGIADGQYQNALKWNTQYEYPKFVISTINDFCKDIYKQNLQSLKAVKGDWTSDWDVLYQGETKRMLKYRWVQNHLPAAEILSAFSSLQYPGANSFGNEINSIYRGLLTYSGHGSGLEYGFGSKEENKTTEEFRDDYVHHAYLQTQELLERISYRLTAPKESFDSHGIMVFNTLSWTRSVPVCVDFSITDMNNYDVIDLSDNQNIPSFRRGDKLFFIAENVPGIGFKQFELKNAAAKAGKEKVSGSEIENQFYKIIFNGTDISIIDKSSGENILLQDSSVKSFLPVRKRFQLNEDFTPVTEKFSGSEIENNSVFAELALNYDSAIFENIKFRLWKNLDRIDVALKTNLTGLKETQYMEEYGLPFVFNTGKSKTTFETLGGLTSLSDRFKAVGHNFMSIRRTVGILGEKQSIIIGSPDCRIFALDTLNGRNMLVANVVNNFPEAWNRNEDKTGSPEFRFSITKIKETGADVTAFGWDVSTEPVVRRSWYKKDKPVQQYLSSSNPSVKIISIRPVDESGTKYELLLQNSSPSGVNKVIMTSDELFSGSKVFEVNYLGETEKEIIVDKNSITLEFVPNSIKKILVLKYR